MKEIHARTLYAELYDVYVPDWPGEIDFYRSMQTQPLVQQHGVLEVACGTGRVALQLAQTGIEITGVDLSPEQLKVAMQRSRSMPNVHWVQGDMQSFELGRQFGLIIMPGHSFQFMDTPEKQFNCIAQLRRHLVPNGVLVIHLDHQDINWLSELSRQNSPAYVKGKILVHPDSGQSYRSAHAWAYERATLTASVQMQWERLDGDGQVVEVWDMPSARLHCVFPFEMTHLFGRVGLAVDAVYGDFYLGPLTEKSSDMVWVARNPSL